MVFPQTRPNQFMCTYKFTVESFYIDNKFFPSTNIIFNNPIGYVSLPSIESEPAGLEALLIAHTPKQLQVSCAYILPVESLDINE